MHIEITSERPDHPDARLLIQELSDYLEPLSPADSRHGYSIDKLLARNVDFFVLWSDGNAAGCGGLEFFGSAYAEVKRMYVRPHFRGRGLGRRMVDHLCAQARDRGVPLVRLETGSMMADAIRLYEGQGFKRIPAFGGYKEDPLSSFFEKSVINTQ